MKKAVLFTGNHEVIILPLEGETIEDLTGGVFEKGQKFISSHNKNCADRLKTVIDYDWKIIDLDEGVIISPFNIDVKEINIDTLPRKTNYKIVSEDQK